MFTFDNYADDYTTKDKWQVGEPWEDRFTGVALDGRDRSLEDHVNADYVRRPFTATLQNLGVGPAIASTVVATFTRGAKVHVEIDITTTTVGTAGHEIYVATLGLPAGLSTNPFTASSMGTFIYYRLGSTGDAISGACTFQGTNGFLWAGGVRTTYIGQDPVFTVASTDVLNVNFSYLPAPSA